MQCTPHRIGKRRRREGREGEEGRGGRGRRKKRSSPTESHSYAPIELIGLLFPRPQEYS
jgi:hypothetical protein